MKEKFYIGGKQYIPEKSHLLCDATISSNNLELFADDIRERIYATKNGGFFHVRNEGPNILAEVLTREEALALLDTFAPYIDTDIYDVVFGAPEMG